MNDLGAKDVAENPTGVLVKLAITESELAKT
jgi:hypothetical protein